MDTLKNNIHLFVICLLIFVSCEHTVKQELVPCADGDYYGYMDRQTRKMIIQGNRYTLAYPFVNNYAIVAGHINDKGTIYSVIDTLGNSALPREYDSIHLLRYGYMLLLKTSGYAPHPLDPKPLSLVDKDLNEVIAPGYSGIEVITERFALVTKNMLKGYYDLKTRKEIIPCLYKTIEIKDELIRAKLEDDYTYFDQSGAKTVPTEHRKKDQITVKLDYGFMEFAIYNSKNQMVFEGEFDDWRMLNTPRNLDHQILTVMTSNYRQKFVGENIKRNRDKSKKYDVIYNYQAGYAIAVNMNTKKLYEVDEEGLIDAKGELVFPYTNEYHFNQIIDREENFVPLDSLILMFHTSLRKYKLLDGKTFEEILPLEYDGISIYNDSLYQVSINDEEGLIDKKGKIVIPTKYADIGSYNEGMCAVWDYNLSLGFVDSAGKEIIPCKYRDIHVFGYTQKTMFKNGYVAVDSEDGFVLLDKKGNEYKLNSNVYDDFIHL